MFGAVAAALAVVGGVVGGIIVHFSADDTTTTETRCPAVSIAQDVLPSVVTLSVTSASGAGGSGSGETIRGDGYILTNDHVIAAGAVGGSIQVLFSSGQSEPATVVGRSIALDLAVVKVDPPESLPTIVTGDSESLDVGQPVVALGAPLGLDGTVTSGIVSALGRQVPLPADGGQTALLPDAIQTDASINPGNSGGALVDCSGHLVGINTAIATVPNAAGQSGGGSVGIGFAIPSDLATTVADQLIAKGKFTPPYVGVSTLPITPAVADRFGAAHGLFVQAVAPNGPAEQAGLKAGDVITEVDGTATTGPESLFAVTVSKQPGDKVSVNYLRDQKPATTTLTLGTTA
jgi:putative serine protease PepD